MSSFYTKPSAADSDYRTGKQGLGGWVLKQQCWSLPLSYPVDIIVAVSVVWQDNGCVQYGHTHFREKEGTHELCHCRVCLQNKELGDSDRTEAMPQKSRCELMMSILLVYKPIPEELRCRFDGTLVW